MPTPPSNSPKGVDKYRAAWKPEPPKPISDAPASIGTPFMVRVLSAPKEGNAPEQYEDAWAHSVLDAPSVTVAVADGASSAVFARQWANLLVKKCAGDGLPQTDGEAAEALAGLGKLWRKSVETKATSWHAQEKLQNGSHAALLLVSFDLPAQTWNARARGDVCVFLVRKNRLKFAFPVTKSAQFGDRPDLISTEPAPPKTEPAQWKQMQAGFEPGDVFYFCTDAVAAWFLQEWEQKREPWQAFFTKTDADFAAWLKEKRDAGDMKNDDVTILAVRVSG